MPSLETRKLASHAAYAPAESDLEKIIVEVWCETLVIDQVGIDDRFFDVGGHSLLVVRLHRALKEKIEQHIVITDLYRFPTIRSFTEFLNSDDDSITLKKGSERAEKRREARGRRRRTR